MKSPEGSVANDQQMKIICSNPEWKILPEFYYVNYVDYKTSV